MADSPIDLATQEPEWSMIDGVPAAALRPFVRRYQGYDSPTPPFVRSRHVPSGDVTMIVTFGNPLRLFDAIQRDAAGIERRGFIAGQHESFAVSETTGRSHGIQIDLTPLGAYMIVGMPMHELTNRHIAIEYVPGLGGRELADRLEYAASWHERFSIADDAIAARLARARRPSEGVAWAWHRIDSSAGAVNIGALAAELGCSRKHLAQSFREQIGVPPKQLARIVRFNRVVRMLRGASSARWPYVAARAGYYDQAHLIRDFREFAGATPGEFLRSGGPARDLPV